MGGDCRDGKEAGGRGMTPSEHNQAEYVRGIQAGKRIERQNQAAIVFRDLAGMFVLGAIFGAFMGVTWL